MMLNYLELNSFSSASHPLAHSMKVMPQQQKQAISMQPESMYLNMMMHNQDPLPFVYQFFCQQSLR